MKTITRKDILFILFLFTITVLSRFFLSADSGNYFGIDPSYFALGAMDYSIVNDRPHLPGYYLHIQSIKLLSSITGDHSVSMIWLSILYSSLAVILVYMIFRKWFNSLYSLLYSLLLITNPLVWFYGCVPEIYAFDLFFGSAIVLCGLSGRMIYLTPAIVALGTGIRQSSGVLILPIYAFLWAIYYLQNKPDIRHIIIVHIVGAALIFAWFFPMANSAGGIKGYIALYGTHNPMQGKAALLGIRQFIINQISIVSLCYTVLLPFAFPITKIYFLRNKYSKNKSDIASNINIDRSLLKICFWWVVPIYIFFIFYHYNKGYMLIILPGILLLLAYLINRTNISVKYIITVIAAQIAIFIFFPYSKTSDEVLFSPEQRSISKFDVWLERFQGPYSMSYGSIRGSNESLSYLKKGMAYCGRLINEKGYTGFFVSSTVQIVPNVLSLLYPQARIYFTQRGHKDEYFVCHFVDITKNHGFGNMAENAVIITSGSFYDKYLSSICKPIYRIGDIVFSVMIHGQQENFSKLYLGLF